jgi:zinc and cadmium transporter
MAGPASRIAPLARVDRHMQLPPLASTVIACLAGGVLAIVAAAGTLALHPSRIGRLVSFAVGALLGAVFLELLPHALEHAPADRVMITVLAGLLAFFLLEKLVLWRHSHGDDTEDDDGHAHVHHGHHAYAPGSDFGRSGLMILIGNSVHNFCDGIVIAASFIANPALGVATTVAIVAHAIPQQVGDFAVLLHSGFARARAFRYNVTTGLATLAGGLAGHFAIAAMQQALPTVLAIAAASLLYVAVADLIPSLHRRPEPIETARQLVLIALGIAIIAVVHVALER